MPRKFALSISLLLPVLLPLLHAQTASTDPNPAATVATPATAAHAPDEMTKKITDLVHTGKYADARELTEGLLIAYPDDHRLIKAKALIEKLLAGAPSFAPFAKGGNAKA